MTTAHPILRQFASVMMGLALFLVAGGHWALLQTVAWTTMVHDYSRTGSLTEAVGKTFDGCHPCPLCQKIAKARTAEDSEGKIPTPTKAEKKAELFVAQAGAEIPLPPEHSLVYGPAPFVSLPERFFAPPVPVPRVFVS